VPHDLLDAASFDDFVFSVDVNHGPSRQRHLNALTQHGPNGTV
jgi:hypothetical protein